ncbi:MULTISPECIES: LysM peptidoglycan-binding domain-containing protein [Aliivibrio]|uniref:LysM domain-containing protein n=2 Tax=Aliivibrio finisterrensis TaxID=511998 RepID=A0A4Q5KVJ4_9GAMM|nr:MULTISPECIES: LysM domain-containing protein [Aliivibrio]MDD9178671.1 LysM domain-containing protein [Aliivibrio sp. A6]RYU52492.1 LysM domain-containing protein [Aliivibrio finisterrensis]RYU55112.1 LysM domain-containing protein [Aliivibrio finisterrensis]RYU59771.1 LysM domain-containing protein [Aliivibrio finisterrensis]RYU65636.1 LysM domain-containing protein [Aliivibrio finisterrensis]
MKQKKNIILLASLMSSLVLTGCASNDELIAQQKNQTEQMSVLESKVSTLESQVGTLEAELQKQKETDSEIYQTVRKLDVAQGELKAQAQQQADKAVMYYTIKQDDTLYSIAREQGIALEDLLQLNPKIANPKRLLIGDVLNIK